MAKVNENYDGSMMRRVYQTSRFGGAMEVLSSAMLYITMLLCMPPSSLYWVIIAKNVHCVISCIGVLMASGVLNDFWPEWVFGEPAVAKKPAGEINVGGMKLKPLNANRSRVPSFQFDSSEETPTE